MKYTLLVLFLLISFVVQITTSDQNPKQNSLDNKTERLQLLLDTYDQEDISNDTLDIYILSLIGNDKSMAENTLIKMKRYQNIAHELDEEEAEKLIQVLHQCQCGEEISLEEKDKLDLFDNDEQKIRRACLISDNQSVRDGNKLIKQLEKILDEQ